MSIKQIIYFLLIVLICSALYTSISNTWRWATDFYGLSVLVSVSDNERSYNPYSKSFNWVSQNTAIFIIKNLEYPYKKCIHISESKGSCQQSRIEFIGRFVGIVDAKTELKIFDIIQFLIQRGEPIDAYGSQGYTALQSAILTNSPKLVSLLLESGANPYLPINREGKLKGKNSIEFIEILLDKNEEVFSKLRKVFYEKIPNKLSKKDAQTRASS